MQNHRSALGRTGCEIVCAVFSKAWLTIAASSLRREDMAFAYRNLLHGERLGLRYTAWEIRVACAMLRALRRRQCTALRYCSSAAYCGWPLSCVLVPFGFELVRNAVSSSGLDCLSHVGTFSWPETTSYKRVTQLG